MVDIDEDQAKSGAIAGAASFVIGLLGAVFLASPSGGDTVFKLSAMGQSSETTWSQMGSASGSRPESWKVAGWVYHKAHFASIDVSISGLGGMGNAVDISFAMEPSILLRLLPVALLVGAGFFIAERTDAADTKEAAINGAYVVAGYAPLAVLSVFLLKWEESGSSGSGGGSIAVEPSLFSALLFTGIVFPVVLGAAGGYLNFEKGDEILEAIGQK